MVSGGLSNRDLSGSDSSPVRLLFGIAFKSFLIAASSLLLFYIVSIYGDALRDPRYFDGWVLVVGMGFQLYFHIGIARKTLSSMAIVRWRKLHIFVGYLLIPAFLLHSDVSLPDTGFELALWSCFVVIVLSGIFGVYISWLLKSRSAIINITGFERIPTHQARLVRDVHVIINSPHPAAALQILPSPPYDAWIGKLYADCLKDFLEYQPSLSDCLMGSGQRLRRVTSEIDQLSGYADGPTQKKLSVIKSLVVEKDQLDAAHVALTLSRAWSFLHVPATYTLIVLTVLHVLIVYAFSSGAW